MDANRKSTAEECLRGAECDTMTFPQILARLAKDGFESYAIDFRRETATYFLSDGDSTQLAIHVDATAIAPTLDANALGAAIREAQILAPGYSYKGFCEKAKRAGCASYIVSLSGGRALYVGRTAETHVEHFPP